MNFIKNRLAITVATIVAASGVTAYTFAAPDYGRIKKDITVMIGIVKSSLKDNESCRNCSVRITGHYLADQGVVFNIDPSSGSPYGFGHSGNDFTAGVVAIPGMVEEILEDVQIRIEKGDFNNWDVYTESEFYEANRDAREELREARQEMRELSREMRELEIEAIHAEEQELKELEAREKELQEEIARAETQEEKIREDINHHSAKRQAERESRKTKKLEERRKQFEQMESVVLETFCDYSSTMRHVPDDEKVSIIVRKGEDESNIYVFNQSKLESCDSAKTNIREHALSYAF